MFMVENKGIEPSPQRWQRRALPLSYTRIKVKERKSGRSGEC